MPTTRSVCRAALLAAFPKCPEFTIDGVLDELAVAASAPASAPPAEPEPTPRLTGDGVTKVQPEEPAGDVWAPPPVGDGQTLLRVVSSSVRDFDDAAGVWLVTVEPVEGGDPIRCRYPADKETLVAIARRAMGLSSTDDVGEAVGRHVVAEVGSFTGRDGAERACVRRWATPSKPKAAKPASKPKAAPSAKPSRNAVQIHGDVDDGEIPF